MGIVYQKNKKTGITYVYKNEAYWDKEKQQSRAKRTLIGKLDPDTGEIVPTRSYQKRQKQDPFIIFTGLYCHLTIGKNKKSLLTTAALLIPCYKPIRSTFSSSYKKIMFADEFVSFALRISI